MPNWYAKIGYHFVLINRRYWTRCASVTNLSHETFSTPSRTAQNGSGRLFVFGINKQSQNRSWKIAKHICFETSHTRALALPLSVELQINGRLRVLSTSFVLAVKLGCFCGDGTKRGSHPAARAYRMQWCKQAAGRECWTLVFENAGREDALLRRRPYGAGCGAGARCVIYLWEARASARMSRMSNDYTCTWAPD